MLTRAFGILFEESEPNSLLLSQICSEPDVHIYTRPKTEDKDLMNTHETRMGEHTSIVLARADLRVIFGAALPQETHCASFHRLAVGISGFRSQQLP